MQFKRLRRNRKSQAIRSLIQETHLRASDFVIPLFIIPGENRTEEIAPMPGVLRYTIDRAIEEAAKLHSEGIAAIALFPVVEKELRNKTASEAYNKDGLIPKAIREIKKQLPTLCIISDVALDPYTVHGHDGIANEKNEIDNDLTLEVLIKQALTQAEAGIDVLAPSDMMDGRVYMIRKALDQAGFHHVSILSYAAKFASAFYAPFRSAIDTKLSFGDKKTYQLNPANVREALLEAKTDEEEGADILMVKPALLYLDILAKLRQETTLPLAAYHVSGEYAMVMASHEKGYLDAGATFYESLLSIKRAGADFIFTYAYPHLRNFIHKL